MLNQSQPLPVLSQSQQVTNIMNNMNNRNSHVMTNQSQSQVRLNNRRWMASNPRNNNNRKAQSHHNNWKESVNTLKEIQQQQNRVKPKRYISKKKFNYNNCKSAPLAPRNTTSFLIRAKKAGGITSLVSPLPVTPAVLPTPVFSPSREILMDTAMEEWGVDGYGSMKGLIRLRSPGNDDESESDVEVERKLDHDLGRFEMICPNYGVSDNNSNSNSNNGYLLEDRVDDQDTHIAKLEEKNLMLKNRLFLMEREFDDLRTRLRCLEMRNQGMFVEEVVENDSENEGNSEVLEEDNNNKKSVDSVLV